jgi:ATP-dependent helicase/nuclease subunit A
VGGVGLRQIILKGEDRPPARVRQQPTVLEEISTDQALSDRWVQRDRVWEEHRAESLIVSPSDFIGMPAAMASSAAQSSRQGRGSTSGKAIGTIVHRVLQHWDFGADVESQVAACTGTTLAIDEPEEAARQAIVNEVHALLRTFARSPAYERLRRTTVIGREVPFLIPWNQGRQILEGAIDLLYRFDGQLWIADYKTDMIPLDQVTARADTYREQARLYREAVTQSLGEPVAGFEFIFLRLGVTVPA